MRARHHAHLLEARGGGVWRNWLGINIPNVPHILRTEVLSFLSCVGSFLLGVDGMGLSGFSYLGYGNRLFCFLSSGLVLVGMDWLIK